MKKRANFIFVNLVIVVITLSCVLFSHTAKSYSFGKHNLKLSDTSTVWLAPKSTNKMKNPLKGKSEAAHKGESLYIQNCSECHGTSGKGDGPTADMLDTKPANLTSKKVQKQSDGAIFWKITNGKGVMAAYKDALTEEQRWQLVNYIRKLKASK